MAKQDLIMKKRIYYILFLFLAFTSISCGDKYNNHYANVLREQRERPIEKSKGEKVDDALLKTNQVVNEKELQQIKGYIERRKWDMHLIGNGINVQEIEKGKGANINDSSIVTINYSIELLNGKKVFSSDIDGKKTIKISEQRDVVGLVYVLKTLKKGSKARAIIPSFLAYGLNGDGDRIPKHASLVYYIEVKEIK